MHRLVAVDLPADERFAQALDRCWDEGDALAPIDQRLAPPAKAALLDALAPDELLDADGRHRLRGGRPVEDGDALVVPTSGTSGEPKGVVLTMRALAASAGATSERLGVDPGADRWLCCLPVSHVGGLSVLVRARLTGTPVELQPRFDPDLVAAALKRGATLVSLVPTALGRLGPGVADQFRAIVLGGSRPPEQLPTNAVTTYGLTESGSGVVYDGVPLAGVEVALAADGEVRLRGEMLLRAYRDGRDPKSPDGFLPTGDLGAFDEAGRLVVFGRRDEVIVSGGEKLWPGPIERVLLGHPGVSDVAVVGVADPEWGERAAACVVPVPGATVRLADLRERCRAELGAVYAPRQLLVLDALPRTAIGKVRRAELSELARAAAP